VFDWNSVYKWSDNVKNGNIDSFQEQFWKKYSKIVKFWKINDIHPWEYPSRSGYYVLISKEM